ncbi:MAG TPA: hypothetical protein VEV41_05640 [Terriglobales bacterium]|nr:hypothetical protein [Terriglobales bacterium]
MTEATNERAITSGEKKKAALAALAGVVSLSRMPALEDRELLPKE